MNDQPEIEKQKRCGEKKTVHQIERTADPRQEIPRILHVRAAFDNRFGQITHNRCEPRSKPSIVACVQVSPGKWPGINLNSIKLENRARPSAPKNPSHVFFALICGTMRCRPTALPVRYAPMSLNFVTAIRYKT